MKRLFDFAFEDIESTQKAETEVEIYAEVTQPEGLKECTRKELQYQLEAQFTNGMNCRVRHTVTDRNESKYVFTFKVKTKNPDGLEANREYNVDVDTDFFEGFKAVANRSLKKIRYVFHSENVEMTLVEHDEKKIITIPNIEYEVDVYEKKDGSSSRYCKIDIEVDNIIKFLKADYPQIDKFKLNIKISHLPFGPKNAILKFSATEEQHAFIDNLWKTEFTQ